LHCKNDIVAAAIRDYISLAHHCHIRSIV
jgi:hypothetical protein